MTRDEFIRAAREAGFRTGNIILYSGDLLPFVAPLSATTCIVELERFAALVAAAEREACAKVCDDNHWEDHRLFADAIRARGQK